MEEKPVYKKFYRKADEHLNGKVIAKHGKRDNQKLKPYVVLQYLLKYSDENNVKSAYDIIGYLNECGMSAERRSIYKDIEGINSVAIMMEQDCTIDEAVEMLEDDEDNGAKLIVYDKNKKGFYVNSEQRHFDFRDIRVLAECVYSAKFLAEGQAKRLVNVVCDFVSEQQAEKIRHDALLTDRVKTNNRAVLNSIASINEAMSRRIDGVAHEPEKITFHYLQYSLGNMEKQVERRKGELYTVSPYKLLINDGNYYLLSFDDKKQKMRTFRVDRMKDVKPTGEPREGKEAFAAINLKDYTKRVFSMYSGKPERVVIRFINPLLDTVVDRFGTDKGSVWYEKIDEKHFTVTAQVEVSDQFFGWLLGFGKRVKILEPESVVEQFKAYVDKVREMY